MHKRERIEPGPGQESVWDYPRPPRLEESGKHIQVIFNGVGSWNNAVPWALSEWWLDPRSPEVASLERG